jgi:hypothetical protein
VGYAGYRNLSNGKPGTSPTRKTELDFGLCPRPTRFRGTPDDSSVRAFAVEPRACGAPLRGFGARPLGTAKQTIRPCHECDLLRSSNEIDRRGTNSS